MDPVWIGYLAAAFTSMAFLPQLVKSFRTKETADLSLPMLFVIAIGVLLWLVYGLFILDNAIILANTISLSIGIAMIMMKLKYYTRQVKL